MIINGTNIPDIYILNLIKVSAKFINAPYYHAIFVILRSHKFITAYFFDTKIFDRKIKIPIIVISIPKYNKKIYEPKSYFGEYLFESILHELCHLIDFEKGTMETYKKRIPHRLQQSELEVANILKNKGIPDMYGKFSKYIKYPKYVLNAINNFNEYFYKKV